MRIRLALIATTAAALVILWANVASAEGVDHSVVPTEMPRSARLLLAVCGELPFQPELVTSILRVELLVIGVELEGGPNDEPRGGAVENRAVVTIDVPECGESNRILAIRVERSGRFGGIERTLELPEPLPDDVERIVALAAAELVQRGWAELSEPVPEPMEPEPEPEPDPPAEPVQREDELSPTERATILEIMERRDDSFRRSDRRNLGFIAYGAGEGRSFPTHRTGMFGATAGVILSLSSLPLAVEFDIGTLFGRSVDLLGTIDIATVLGGVGLLVGGRHRAMSGAVGIRVEVGWARARGQSDSESVHEGTADAALVLIASRGLIGFTLTRRLGLFVSTDVGYTLLGLELGADERRVAGISGVSLAWSVGMAFM